MCAKIGLFVEFGEALGDCTMQNPSTAASWETRIFMDQTPDQLKTTRGTGDSTGVVVLLTQGAEKGAKKGVCDDQTAGGDCKGFDDSDDLNKLSNCDTDVMTKFKSMAHAWDGNFTGRYSNSLSWKKVRTEQKEKWLEFKTSGATGLFGYFATLTAQAMQLNVEKNYNILFENSCWADYVPLERGMVIWTDFGGDSRMAPIETKVLEAARQFGGR
jgi:hypothetical protein